MTESFFDWMRKQTLLAQAMFTVVMLDVLRRSMKQVLEKEVWRREDSAEAGVTQAYKAGEGETDLRIKWWQMRNQLEEMEILIAKIEERARG